MTPGQAAYEAFWGEIRHTPWDGLMDYTRDRWEVAAVAAAKAWQAEAARRD